MSSTDSGSSDTEKAHNRIYISDESQAPDDAEIKEADDGRQYFDVTFHEQASALYSDETEGELEEETDVEMPDADDAGEGVSSEESFDDVLDDIRSRVSGE